MLFDEYTGNLLAISSIKEEKIGNNPKKKGKIVEPDSADELNENSGINKKKNKKKMIVCDTELTEEQMNEYPVLVKDKKDTPPKQQKK